LVLAGAVGGILVAGMAFPAVAGVGLAARNSAVSFENLPSDLKVPPLPQRSTILAADGSFITSLYSQNRIVVQGTDIPDVMRKALVAIEDARFYEHGGIDIHGVLRAFLANQEAGRITQGASTLTQQYVKMVLEASATTPAEKAAAVADTMARKLREARYAMALEQKLSKNEILTRYLNIAYFGAGAYGVGTAAQVYFGKPVNQLTVPEAAMLAGLVQSPTAYDPIKNPKDALARRNTVIDRMQQLGYLTAAQADQARQAPLGLHPSQVPNGCVNAVQAPHLCQLVVDTLLNSPAFGSTPQARQARLFAGGLTIKTTLDPRLQKLAQAAVNNTYPASSPFAAGLVTVQPGTGYIKDMAVSRPFPQDQNQYLITGFQTGSTAKAFMLVAALEKGLPLTTRIYAPYRYTSRKLFNYVNGSRVPYFVQNDSLGMNGVYDMRTAFAASINTYFVQLEERVGVDAGVRAAEAMGAHSGQFAGMAASPLDSGSFTLGSAYISPLDMANAYATIAARGKECTPQPILSVTDASGKAVAGLGGTSCKQAIDPAVADAATEAMTWTINPKGFVLDGATGTAASIGRPAAGKTGTTEQIKEAWFVGFTPQLATASLVFDPKHLQTLPGGDASNQISVRAWRDFMAPAMAPLPVVDFVPPEAKFLYGGSSATPPTTAPQGGNSQNRPAPAAAPTPAATCNPQQNNCKKNH